MAFFAPCNFSCAHFDCCSVRGVFATPPCNPWFQVQDCRGAWYTPLPPRQLSSSPRSVPFWELVKGEEKERAPRPIRLRVPRVPPPRKQLPIEELFEGKSILGFKFVGPENRLREKIRASEARKDGRRPAFIFIAGVKCPPIGRTWRWYIRRSGESVRGWHHRIRQLVGAMVMGRKLCAHSKNLELSPWEQLLKLTGRWNFSPFDLLSEVVLEEDVPAFCWEKFKSAPVLKVRKEKNARHRQWCEEMLQRKLRLERLRQDSLELRPRQRQRLAAVVHFDRKNHTCWSLKNRMTNELTHLVRKDPLAFLPQEEIICSEFGPDRFWGDEIGCPEDEIEIDLDPNFIDVGAKGEMDDVKKDAHGSNNVPISEKKSNVVLEQQTSDSKAEALPPTKAEDEYSCFAATATPRTVEQYANRWITIKKGVWDVSKKTDEELFSLTLPLDALKTTDFQNSPNYVPFRQNTLWRGNMKVKVMLNSNARQYGQFQVRFYYSAYLDKNASDRNNIYTGSQMPHVLVNAATSNSGELSIPFEYFNPLMSITKGEQTWDTPPDANMAANLGVLYGRVVVPLTVALTTPTQCTYSVLIAFEDNQFNGMVDARLIANSLNSEEAEGEMFPIAAAFALTEVKNMLDDNRDNPTLSFAGMPVYPVNSGSWCFGNGLGEWTNVLRLDPKGVTPYAQGRVPAVDEMKIDYIKKIFGMFRIVHWDVSNNPGYLLFKFDASPLFQITDYPQIKKTVGSKSNTCYCIPPVGVLTSMFSWWRGSLKLRIDVVGGTELTGRLLVAYIPKYYKEVTMNVAINCTHSIFDLQTSNRQFNFEIPFFSEKLFWERAKNLRDVYSPQPPPGTVYIFVYQELIPNATIPSDCELVLYIAGGDDFEVSVPALPIVASSFFPIIQVNATSTSRMTSKADYFPVYVGSWDHLKSDVPVFRYRTTTQRIAQFTGDLKNLYLVCAIDNANQPSASGNRYKMAFTFNKTFDPNIASISASYVVFIKNNGYIYCIPLPFMYMSTALTVIIKKQIKQLRLLVNANKEIDFTKFSNWYEMMLEGLTINDFNECIGKYVSPPITAKAPDEFLFSFKYNNPSDWWKPAIAINADVIANARPSVQGEAGDEKSSTETKPSQPLKTACGRKASVQVFGERFTDLKDVCRRYQLYARGGVTVTEGHQVTRTVVLKFPALPHGLDLKTMIATDVSTELIDEYWNRTREGPIPLIASGYRFFTGSLRFRAVLNVNNKRQNLVARVFVQHRPDMYMEDLQVEQRAGQDIGTDDIEHPGYAAYQQVDSINNVICFEIPFYLPVVRSLLQRPIKDIIKWAGLGQIAIGITLPYTEAELSYDIYYSLGDDARFSVFVGFPPMIDLTNIPPSKVPEEETGTIAQACETINKHAKAIKEKTVEIRDKSNFIKRNCRSKQLVAFSRTSDSEFSVISEPEDHGIQSEGSFSSDFFDPNAQGEMGLWDWMPGGNVSKAADVVSKIDPEKVNSALENMSETTGLFTKFKDSILQSIPTFDSLKNRVEKYVSLIINVVTNFIHCLISLNIKSILVAIVSILTQIKIVAISCVSELTESLSKLFAVFSSSQLKEEGIPVGNMMECEDEINNLSSREKITEERNCVAAYVSTLVAGVGAALAIGVKLKGSNFKSIVLMLYDSLRSFAMTANCLYTFVKNNLVCAQKIGNWLVDDSPQMRDIQFLKDQNDNIYNWALEAIELIDPWKEDELFVNVKRASRVHILHFSGTLILLNLGNCRIDPQQYRVLEKIFERLNTLKDRLVKAHKAPPVRFEPFVYELTGGTGIGKSELLNRIPYELLKFLNIKVRGEVIYHRALGNAYWNNCRNQPVCSIDEKFPIQQQGFSDVQLAELFQLKSRCIFNPPMADLPDKNLRYNPLIVQYASNDAFPKLTGILDPNAVYRRRDALIKIQMKEQFIGKTIDQLSYDQRRNFRCLEFYFANDVKIRETTWHGPLSYEAFMERLKDQWYHYYVQEEGKFQQHLTRALQLVPEENEALPTFEERWREHCDLNSGENEISAFRNEYHNLLKLCKEKQEHPNAREAMSYKLMRKYFKCKQDEQDLSLEQIKVKINDLRKELIEKPKVLINQGASVSGQMPLVDDARIVKDAIDEDHQIIQERLLALKKDNKLCGHFLIWEIANSKKAGLLSFDSKTQSYYISKRNANSFLSECSVKNPLTINDFNKNLTKTENKDYFYSNSCSEDNCPFKSYDNRILVSKRLAQTNPLVHGYIASLQLDYLSDRVSKEYLLYLEGKLKKAIDKDIPGVHAEVENVKNWYEKVKEKLMSVNWKKWFQRLALILGFFFFVGLLMKVFVVGSAESGLVACSTAAAMTSDPLICGEAHASGDYKQGAVKKETPRSVALKTLQSLPEGHMAPMLQHTIYGCLARNSFFLSMYDTEGHFLSGRCLGISGNYAILVDHYWESWQNFSKQRGVTSMHFIPCSNANPTAINLSFNELEYTKFKDSALGLLKLPLRLSCFKDIRKKIASRASHAYVNGLGIIAEATNGVGKQEMQLKIIPHQIKFDRSPKMIVRGGQFYSDFKTSDCYKYQDFHGVGKCGSVLLAGDMPTPIVGLHIAGATEGIMYGYAEMIYREMFDHLPNASPPRASSRGEMNGTSDWFIDGEVIGIGKIASSFAHRANEKSRIIPSKVQSSPYSPFPVFTEVAVLSPKDPRISQNSFSPMLEGCKHHGKPLFPFNKDDLAEAVLDFKNIILAKCTPQRLNPGLLNLDVAINGVDGKDGYDHIEWNSSEGFPFVAERPKGQHNKKWMFNFDDQGKCIGINKNCSLISVMNEKWRQRNVGIIPETVFTDCLKDCRIEKSKVLEPGKTRIFSISPVDFTLHQRQCTLDFVVSFMANRLDLEHAIGINPDGFEWASLANQLLQKGDHIVTGDYSKFGDTIPPEIIHAFFGIVIAWYKKYGELSFEHENQLKIMAFEIGNSIHLMFDFLYQVVCGQPSGNSLTVIINSFANSIYLRLAWLHTMRFTPFSGLEGFHKHIKMFSYGDDLIIALSDEIKDHFNAKHLHLFFSKYKLKFTNSNKGDEIVPYTNLAQADFLKRGFLPHPKRIIPQAILAPLKIESIIDTVNWVNKDSFGLSNPNCTNYLDMSLQVCEDALRNAFGHGPEYYEKFRQQLQTFWQNYNIVFISNRWEDLDKKVFDLNLAISPFFKKYNVPKS